MVPGKLASLCGNISRVFLVANNDALDPLVLHNLAVTRDDLVVQFNTCRHAAHFAEARTLLVFGNDARGLAPGFGDDGAPGPALKAVFARGGPIEGVAFSHHVPDAVAPHLPAGVPRFTLAAYGAAGAYPRGLSPSLGFRAYSLFTTIRAVGAGGFLLYTVGFGSARVGTGQRPAHDFHYERWAMARDAAQDVPVIQVPAGGEPPERPAPVPAPAPVPTPAPTPAWGHVPVRGADGVVAGLARRDDIAGFLKPGGVGIELGVAEGVFAERILRRSLLAHLFGVDMYAGDRGHDTAQYRTALARLLPFKERHSLLRMRFDEALGLFPDGHFDFIYVDGYAHTGEEGGATFEDWYPKLKPGGMMAGDDYHEEWPLVKRAVDGFVARHGLDLHVVRCHEPDSTWSLWPTWFAFKPA